MRLLTFVGPSVWKVESKELFSRTAAPGYPVCHDVALCCDVADIVNLDIKSTLRVLYNLFTKYKNIS